MVTVGVDGMGLGDDTPLPGELRIRSSSGKRCMYLHLSP